MQNWNEDLRAWFSIIMYVVGFALILIGIYLALFHEDLERDAGFALITFCSALVLHGLTQKSQK